MDELLEFTEDDEELPQITASGTISEGMSGGFYTSNPMGTTFQLTADFSAGTITGTLKGARTSTPGGWMNCFDPADPSVEFDRIDVNTTESYDASFTGSIDKETGEFSIAISPVGQTSATKVSLFTHERCLDLNSGITPVNRVGMAKAPSAAGFPRMAVSNSAQAGHTHGSRVRSR